MLSFDTSCNSATLTFWPPPGKNANAGTSVQYSVYRYGYDGTCTVVRSSWQLVYSEYFLYDKRRSEFVARLFFYFLPFFFKAFREFVAPIAKDECMASTQHCTWVCPLQWYSYPWVRCRFSLWISPHPTRISKSRWGKKQSTCSHPSLSLLYSYRSIILSSRTLCNTQVLSLWEHWTFVSCALQFLYEPVLRDTKKREDSFYDKQKHHYVV